MAKGKYQQWLEPDGLIVLEGWARDGLTDEQIATNMGVSVRTLYVWKDKYQQILQSLKKGKEVVDLQVENALLKRALGYQYDEVTQESGQVVDPDSGKLVPVMVETKRVTKEVQPDTTAQIFWLKNRQPAKWRDKQEVEHSGKLQHQAIEELSDDELRERIAAEVAAITELQARAPAPDKG